MSDSDKDTSAAIDKVVGAFRAQREQGKAAAPEADAEPKREPTPVTRLDETAPKPQGGGGSEAPTKAFKVPTEALAAAAAAKSDATEGDSAEDDAAADAPETTGLREENVVGDQIAAEATDDSAAADVPHVEKAELVEQSIDLPADETADDSSEGEGAAGATPEDEVTDDDESDAADETPTETISADEVAAATENEASEAPTTQMKVPAAAAAAAATAAAGTAAVAKSGPKTATPAEPQVIAPAEKAPSKRKSGKLVAILLAVVVVIAVVAIGLWYLLVGQSDQTKVADAAKDYQNAMAEGDLDDLRDITCGAKLDYYSNVSPEDFQKAVDAQRSRNEMMTFDDVQAVEIDGDVARVGVDMYPSSDPSKTVPAQITLHKIDGEWKVCTEP